MLYCSKQYCYVFSRSGCGFGTGYIFFSDCIPSGGGKASREQKQFITDASHELKTPLTIIDANTEVIEMETGENQWTKSTRKQIQRLSGMVQQLVAL